MQDGFFLYSLNLFPLDVYFPVTCLLCAVLSMHLSHRGFQCLQFQHNFHAPVWLSTLLALSGNKVNCNGK